MATKRQSKATSSLFLNEMIAKLERTLLHNKTRTKRKKSHKQWEQQLTMNQQKNHHLRMNSSQTFARDSAAVKTQKLFQV